MSALPSPLLSVPPTLFPIMSAHPSSLLSVLPTLFPILSSFSSIIHSGLVVFSLFGIVVCLSHCSFTWTIWESWGLFFAFTASNMEQGFLSINTLFSFSFNNLSSMKLSAPFPFSGVKTLVFFHLTLYRLNHALKRCLVTPNQMILLQDYESS